MVVVLYWVLPRRPRVWLLFLASLTFYGFWRVEFVPVMLLSAVTDYLISLRLGKTEDSGQRRILLSISLAVNLGLLFFFKYLIFFGQNVNFLAQGLGSDLRFPELNIILPLGISFYTFQTISYTVDVYRRKIEPVRDFALYATYVTFFPQLVAGPILRAGEVVYQLDRRPRFNFEDISFGIRRILYGLFLKVCLADTIAPLVDAGYAQTASAISALDVWTLAFAFGFQIYFDFSAYSHVAIGCARLMGIEFPENFDFPYLAASPRDFWRRWHISLSSWIRDYLYLPLAGARVMNHSIGGLAGAAASPSSSRLTLSLFLTWAIMGLWHGANWTFVGWGIYHAVFVFSYRLLRSRCEVLPLLVRRYGGWLVTLPLAMLSWIFFRAETLTQALTMYAIILDPRRYGSLGLREDVHIFTAFLMLAMLIVFFAKTWLLPRIREHVIFWLPLESVVFLVIVMGVFVYLRPIRQFIYFQF